MSLDHALRNNNQTTVNNSPEALRQHGAPACSQLIAQCYAESVDRKFHVTSVRMRTGNHQPSWPTLPQILSVLGTVFTCASSRFFLPFFCARFFAASFSTSP
ncbi:hypothetical protein E2C01_057802 [Portunus trituberculatus]|uniref:Uncharacterized protein n=1 Tax=Portunus trituberculatus TaxID=210409 RepID=A0A5B7GUI1_PORTR|nr:hypothetical protein [Portunus trituberculatus]